MEIYRMKKSLFAVAALSAIAGTAQAQSSVTVYGILDVGYIGSNTSATTTAATSGTNGLTKQQTSQFGQNAEQTSRLGFKGNEDMGGGTSTFFTIEMGLNPQLGNLSGSSAVSPSYDRQQTTNTSGSAIDNRQTFVGVKKNGIGQFSLGRQYTPIFNSGAATSPGQYNNVMGDSIYAGSSVSGITGPNSYLSGFTNRTDNTLQVDTDTFAGFKGHAMYALNNSNTTGIYGSSTTGGNVNWGGWGLGADYTWNKLFVTVAAQQFRTKYDNSIYTGSTGTIMDINGASPTSGQWVQSKYTMIYGPTNTSDKQMFAGATYDFGILKAYLQYVNRTIYQNTTSGGAVADGSSQVLGQQYKRSAEQIGVRSYITPTIEAWASAAVVQSTTAVSATSNTSLMTNPGTSYQLGSNYYLSKRTNLYAIFGAYNSSSPTQNNGVAGSGNQYALGMRHTF